MIDYNPLIGLLKLYLIQLKEDKPWLMQDNPVNHSADS
jgi:hypothetical protein